MSKDRKILLSFDVEEFDLPLEYGQAICVERQLQVGYEGLLELMPLLQQPFVTTTLFTTAFFAVSYPDTVQELASGHEIASHAFYHSSFCEQDLRTSRETLETITGQQVYGLRMPRMKHVQPDEVKRAGYQYNSSINPTWLPGRYNNTKFPRKPFEEQGILQVPVSVTPRLRIPLFWLAFKNLPYHLFLRLALSTLKKDNYLLLYFHPWEWADLSAFSALPVYVKKGGRRVLYEKIKRLLYDLSNEGDFCTIDKFSKTCVQQP
ncbi:polysaccharide deacetylase family protein [Flavisolibacter nicotianae]|uniref:polysaccharide deacetylase family protein n=1 Tax=Flavisolibacter nicotianae TaxID=2364882 RepID=UPI000EB1FA19|nr:polysaccharide deacetylase family protein [Flavisolibacter nicotianae]